MKMLKLAYRRRTSARVAEPPTVDEGLYARVEVVRSREDADALLRRWGAYEIDVIQ